MFQWAAVDARKQPVAIIDPVKFILTLNQHLMKNCLILSTALLLCISGLAQDLNYEVRGTYTRAIKQEKLRSPKRLSDLIEGYPVNWIDGYTSVELSASCHGKERKASSANDSLSPEQQQMLQAADLASKIIISVNYSYQVPVTRVMEHNTMHVEMTVVPQHEAQYIEGHEKLIQYLKDNSPRIPEAGSKELQQLIIRFTINEHGKVSHPKIKRSFSDKETDRHFLKLIQNMPEWKAAENPEGTRVKQEFEFVAGRGGGC